MKWFLGILVSLAVGVLFVAELYVPNRFHHLIHQEILKDLGSGKVYKVIDSSTHQTVITTEKDSKTYTSVTSLNPLNNYVLFESKDLQDPSKSVSAKITYDIADFKDFRINALFTDVANENFTILKPLLSFSTPLNIGLIKSKDKKIYIASHMQIAFSAEKLKYKIGEAVNDFSFILASITSKTTTDPDIVSIVGSFSAKELLTQSTDSVSGKFTDAENVLTIESFKISGFQALMKKDDGPAAAADVPLAMKAMGLIPKLESLVTVPFKISIATTASHESGKMPMNFELNIKNVNIMEPDAYIFKANLSLPYGLLKSYLVDTMSVTLAQTQGKDFSHPDFSEAKRPIGDFGLAMKFEQDKNEKITTAFKEFLNQGKAEIILQKAIELELLKKEGNVYNAEFVMQNMVMSLNGKTNFKEELVQTIPQTEIDAFLVSKGFVSLVALANGPKKNCHTLLPGFPKTNGTFLPKESCVSSCEGITAFCMTNPNEKHLCYLYQCSWEDEVLSFKNSAPIPAEKATITKHMAEVSAKLKSLKQIK